MSSNNINTELSKVTKIMNRSLDSEDADIFKIYSFLTETNGKMLRPRLFLETINLFNKKITEKYKISASFELIHLASLLHDDVIDNSTLRRGKETVWKLWNTNTAILAGDYIWSKAFGLLIENSDKKIQKIIINSTSKMIEGELKDNLISGKLNLNIDDYFQSISNKTASLFEAICESASVLCNDLLIKKNLKVFGYNFGMAFQIMDDVNDLIHSENVSGKTASNDLKQKKITLPLILALENCSSGEKSLLNKSINNDDVFKNTANQIIKKYKSIDESKKIAKSYVLKSVKSIKPLKGKYKTEKLISLAEQLVN